MGWETRLIVESKCADGIICGDAEATKFFFQHLGKTFGFSIGSVNNHKIYRNLSKAKYLALITIWKLVVILFNKNSQNNTF